MLVRPGTTRRAVQKNHPLLKGCRLLAVLDGNVSVRNLVGRGPDGAVSGSPVMTRLGRWPALTLSGSSWVTFGTNFASEYGLTAGGGLTVLCRCRPNAAQLGGLVTTRNVGTLADGFGLLAGDTADYDGITGEIYGGGTTLRQDDNLGSAAYAAKDIVAAITYDHRSTERRVSVYTRVGNSGPVFRASNADTGTAWDPAGTQTLYLGRFGDGYSFGGEIAWVMVFDGCLSPGHVARLMRDEDWPFLAEEPIAYAGSVPVTYRTVTGSVTGYSPSGVVTYTTDTDAECYVGSDLTGGSGMGGSVTYRTEVRAGQTYSAELPTLVRYATVVGVAGSLTQNGIATYTTTVGVQQRPRSLLEGRRDLIGVQLYRR